MEQDKVFRVPSESERLAAIDFNSVPKEKSKLYFPDPIFFQPIPKPGPSDWLTSHAKSESKQTFSEYQMNVKGSLPMSKQCLYLVPMGSFGGPNSPDLNTLLEFAKKFFTMDTQILSNMELLSQSTRRVVFKWNGRVFEIKSRMNGNSYQMYTKDIIAALTQMKKELTNAFSITAITLFDLYPRESWNYVFGEASLKSSVGVFSFVRYNPLFYSLHNDKETTPMVLNDYEMDDEEKRVFVKSCCSVMVHEMGHMFGVCHCCYFDCVMNGSNHLEESQSRPLFLCPMDLRKLQYHIQFDEMERYKGLLGFYEENQGIFIEEYVWLSNRLSSLMDN